MLHDLCFVTEDKAYKVFFAIDYDNTKKPFKIRIGLVGKNKIDEHVMEIDTTRKSPMYFKYEVDNNNYKEIRLQIEKE